MRFSINKVTTANFKTYPLFVSPTDHIVDSTGCHRSRLLKMAAYLSNVLIAEISDASSGTEWLVAVSSPLWFSASVIGCWKAGVIPMISADLQSGTVSELLPSIAGVITDDSAFRGLNCPTICCTDDFWGTAESDEQEIPLMDGTDTGLVLFTSGSTGQKKRVEKSFEALFEEVINLEHMYGDAVRGLPRRTTVSHFHIYGFLFNILWPLHAGHVLASETTFYWEQALADGANGGCIVSSPAHLRFLPSLAVSAAFCFEKSVIFSSGGPLDGAVAAEIEQQTGQCPIEVFGSTETGGIAWRQQRNGSPHPFQTFPGVEVKQNAECGLLVRSMWTGMRQNWLETGDLVELLPEGAFFLRGRYDTVVKIAGKRVSVTEMEREIGKLPGVVSARVFQYSRDGKEARSALAAVIAVGSPGEIPMGTNKSIRVKEMKQQLRRRFDLVTLPRYWRFVAEMPRDSQGKVTLQLLGDVLNHE
ncbi:MAG: acyl-CoA synthetase [Deltaproteobacteria bacterium]|nr:acyl-CoA synthetase [Deltaproteobacteria bacterium]MBN2673295.1 acyl-CoA synthetase [Deltaproteobacteria bacterium]